VEINDSVAVVQVGGLRLKTNYEKLIRVEDGSHKKNRRQDRIRVNIAGRDTGTRVKPSLDIRGQRGPDAIREVTHYLDNALASGLNQVEIIHGKGEGILKKLVHEYLEQRPEVRDFDIAPLNQGGSGCTIVKL
jgi:DNA mismatch repair protein MutS2